MLKIAGTLCLAVIILSCKTRIPLAAPPPNSGHYSQLQFEVIYLDAKVIRYLSDSGIGLVFQLRNEKEGYKGRDKRHLFGLTAYAVYNDTTRHEVPSIFYSYSVKGDTVAIGDENAGTDIKIGNYPARFSQLHLDTIVRYVRLVPTEGGVDVTNYPPRSVDFTNYVRYQIIYLDAKFQPIPAFMGLSTFLVYLDPSPPA